MSFNWAIGPTEHVTWNELACHDLNKTPYPEEWKVSRAIALCELFETIRTLSGNKPIIILSAYRTVEHNRKVGGAAKSQHVQGRALDLRPPEGVKINDFHKIINELSKLNTLLKGVGKYSKFVHIDIRPTQQVAHWTGSNVTRNV